MTDTNLIWLSMFVVIVVRFLTLKVDLLFFALFSQILILVGLMRLADQGLANNTNVYLFTCAIGCLCIGFALRQPGSVHDAATQNHFELSRVPHEALVPSVFSGKESAKNSWSRRRCQNTRIETAPNHLAMAIAVSFVAVGANYHLLASGIPLFSESIETTRFDFTSSGLLGVPGRMYLYGTPIVWLFATVAARLSAPNCRAYRPWVFATALYLEIALLGGFKSGLLAMVVTMTIGYTLVWQRHISFAKVLAKWWWIIPIILTYTLIVAGLYPTYNQNEHSLWLQLLDRVTGGSAQPSAYIFNQYVPMLSNNGILNDLFYFVPKYVGMTSDGQFSVERAVSAGIIGVDPASSSWTTPVTVGAFAELYVSLGPILSCASFVLVGAGFSRVLHGRVSFGSMAFRTTCAFAMYNWLVKGGLVYYALNVAVVAVVIAVLLRLLHLISNWCGVSISSDSHQALRSPIEVDR